MTDETREEIEEKLRLSPKYFDQFVVETISFDTDSEPLWRAINYLLHAIHTEAPLDASVQAVARELTPMIEKHVALEAGEVKAKPRAYEQAKRDFVDTVGKMFQPVDRARKAGM